jgi:hypothetical protein
LQSGIANRSGADHHWTIRSAVLLTLTLHANAAGRQRKCSDGNHYCHEYSDELELPRHSQFRLSIVDRITSVCDSCHSPIGLSQS